MCVRQAKGGRGAQSSYQGDSLYREFLAEEWPVPSVVGRNPHGNACGAYSGQCAGTTSRR